MACIEPSGVCSLAPIYRIVITFNPNGKHWLLIDLITFTSSA